MIKLLRRSRNQPEPDLRIEPARKPIERSPNTFYARKYAKRLGAQVAHYTLIDPSPLDAAELQDVWAQFVLQFGSPDDTTVIYLQETFHSAWRHTLESADIADSTIEPVDSSEYPESVKPIFPSEGTS